MGIDISPPHLYSLKILSAYYTRSVELATMLQGLWDVMQMKHSADRHRHWSRKDISDHIKCIFPFNDDALTASSHNPTELFIWISAQFFCKLDISMRIKRLNIFGIYPLKDCRFFSKSLSNAAGSKGMPVEKTDRVIHLADILKKVYEQCGASTTLIFA